MKHIWSEEIFSILELSSPTSVRMTEMQNLFLKFGREVPMKILQLSFSGCFIHDFSFAFNLSVWSCFQVLNYLKHTCSPWTEKLTLWCSYRLLLGISCLTLHKGQNLCRRDLMDEADQRGWIMAQTPFNSFHCAAHDYTMKISGCILLISYHLNPGSVLH